MKKRSNLEIALEHECNFRSRSECPSQNKRFTQNIFHQENVENDINNAQIFYFGCLKKQSRSIWEPKKIPHSNTQEYHRIALSMSGI